MYAPETHQNAPPLPPQHALATCLQQALVLGPGDYVNASSTDGDKQFKFLLIAGAPINEPIVQHGPMVMNTQVRAIIGYETVCV